MVASSHHNHIRNQLGRDGRTRFILFVHPGIRKTGDDGGNPASRCGFACGYQNEELHEIVIHITASRLYDEHILFSDGFGDFNVDFATGEPSDSARCQGHAQPMVR
jgi:hypothetical protein